MFELERGLEMLELQNFVSKYGMGIRVEELVVKAYRRLVIDGHDCFILNERYINVDGHNYQLIRKNRQWTVKEF